MIWFVCLYRHVGFDEALSNWNQIYIPYRHKFSHKHRDEVYAPTMISENRKQSLILTQETNMNAKALYRRETVDKCVKIPCNKIFRSSSRWPKAFPSQSCCSCIVFKEHAVDGCIVSFNETQLNTLVSKSTHSSMQPSHIFCSIAAQKPTNNVLLIL